MTGGARRRVARKDSHGSHPRYEDVLRRLGRRRSGLGQSPILAARAFFTMLGAEDAPRLVTPSHVDTRYGDPASPIDPPKVSASQREVLGGLRRHATHLQGDRLSPDLDAVIRSLQRERGLRNRRDRARALIRTLDREWQLLYAPYTETRAVWSDFSWHVAGTIPATWLARARDERWLTSEAGKKKTPRELAVRTPATEAIFGNDRGSFAYGLDESDAASPAVRALGIDTDPQVSEMVEQLVVLRDGSAAIDDQAVNLRYAAISAACKKRDLGPDDMVGDISVRQLRARFGGQRSKPGLVYAAAQWLAPTRVLMGAPIFGNRRAFVSELTASEPLWRALRLSRPSVADCIDVLEEIGREPLQPEDEQVLVDTYRFLEGALAKASQRDRARLRNLPLWTGAAWHSERNPPVYVVADPGVAAALSPRLAVWQLPVEAATVPMLIAATGATTLPDDAFDPVVTEQAFLDGTALTGDFVSAVELLRDWLARHDSTLFEARSLTWEELANARIAVDSQLQLQLRLGRRDQSQFPREHM